ncbi:MAG: D-alanyl-D-alanine carboxypeptidase family protein, partial [Acidimicrobiales bacterium]
AAGSALGAVAALGSVRLRRPPRSRRPAPAPTWSGRKNRRGILFWLKLIAVLVLVVVVAAAVFVAVQLERAVPRPSLQTVSVKSAAVPGPAPAIPWPKAGQAELAVAGIGSFGPVGSTSPIPIGSIAKVMAAYVILHDHPLTGTATGPGITVTAADVALYRTDLASQDSVAAVTAGEVLTERQALEALLIPSGDNIAVLLANWDAGSVPAFVAKMNSTAAALGMHHTHYADVSGLSARTTSTASDQLRLAPAVMADPVFAGIVAMPQVTLPVAGTVYNYNSLVGRDGVIGIKTGSTPQAGGCLLFAAKAKLAGQPETIYGAVLGQPSAGHGIIAASLAVSQRLLDAAKAAVHQVTILPAGTLGAKVETPWAGATPAVTPTPVRFIGWPGLPTKVTVSRGSAPARSSPAGTVVGHVKVQLGSQHASVPLRTTKATSGPTIGWRLRHG